MLAAAAAIAFFFLVWGLLRETGDELPWVTAGVGASIVLGGAAVLREVILRRARENHLRLERRVRDNFSGLRPQFDQRASDKLTLEKNAAILGDIKRKSAAAKVLNKFSAGHREVFELCGQYLARIETELTTVSAGSPRLSALLKGRTSAAKLHRYHLMHWAEIEARSLTNEANTLANVSDKLRAAKNAMNVVEFALQSYPAEENLIESRHVLRELAVSITVSDLAERAERAVFRSDRREAMSIYRDALFYLGRDNVHTAERQELADRINAEMDKLRLLEGGE